MSRWLSGAVSGAVFALPLAVALAMKLPEAVAELIGVGGVVVLVIGGVVSQVTAGLAARRLETGITWRVARATVSYFVGASVVLSAAWLVALRWSTLHGFDVATSIGIGALVSLWSIAAISGVVVGVVVRASTALLGRRSR